MAGEDDWWKSAPVVGGGNWWEDAPLVDPPPTEIDRNQWEATSAREPVLAAGLAELSDATRNARRDGPAFEHFGRGAPARPAGPAFERIGRGNQPEPPVTAGPAFELSGRNRDGGRRGGYSGAEWAAMTRNERQARGLPVSEFGWLLWGNPENELVKYIRDQEADKRATARLAEEERLASLYDASLDEKASVPVAPVFPAEKEEPMPREADLITDQAMAAFAAGDDAEGKRLLTEANRAAIAAGAVPEGFVADPRTGGFSDIQNDPSLDMGTIPSLGFGAMQGLGFNFGDEAIGKLEAVTGGDEQFAVERAREMDRRAQESPWAYYGGFVPGAVASSLSLGKAIGVAGKAMGLGATAGSSLAGRAGLGAASLAGRAGLLAGRAGLGAATGALEGGLAGFGAGEGGFDSRMASAGKMAALGAGIGLAAPLAMAGLGAVMKTPVNALASAFNIPSNVRASEAVAKMLRRAGMSADDAKRAIDQAAAEGQDVYKLVDALGLSGQRGLAGIARQPGDTARQEIAEFLTTRQAGQGDRLAGFVADALDAPDTAAARAAAMKTARDEAADLAYTAAREGAGPVDVRGALAVIDDRIGPMTGSGIADDGISGKLSRYRGRLAADDPAASVIKGETGIAGAGHNSAKTAVELSDFDRVLILKQEIGDDIGAAVRAGRNNEARELMKVQKALDEALEAASPGYRSANDEFAKASKAIGAVDAGKAAAGPRIRSEDTAARFGGLADDGKSAFRAGYADPVIAKIDASAMGVNKARPLSGTKTAKDFDFLAKDPELIKRQIARENAMFETNVAALGGSKTADNLADAADMSSMSSSMIANFLTGNWGAAARQAADKVVSGATGMNPSTREIIAKALLSSNPAAALAPAAKRAGQLETPRKVIEALIRSGAIRLQ